MTVDESRSNGLRRRIAPCVVVSHRALQRHPPVRPLILGVQGRGSDTIALRVDPKTLGQRRGSPAVERIGEVQVVPEVLDVFHQVAAVVPELHVVGTGDVGRRKAPPVRVVEVVGPVGRTVIEIGDSAVPGCDLGHAGEAYDHHHFMGNYILDVPDKMPYD